MWSPAPDLSTPTKLKKYIEKEFKRALEMANGDWLAEKFLRSPYAARRQAAIVNIREDVESTLEDIGIEAPFPTYLRYELFTRYYNTLFDDDYNLRIGAALWILEKLWTSGKLGEALKLLPEIDYGSDEAWRLPPGFRHPCFSNEMITSVICAITYRYPGEQDEPVVNRKNAKGILPEPEWLELMTLLPKEDVIHACTEFTEKTQEIMIRYMMGLHYYEKECRKIRMRICGAGDPVRGPMLSGQQPVSEEVQKLVGPLFGKNPDTLTTAAARMAVDIRDMVSKMDDYERHFEDLLMLDSRSLRREADSREVAEALMGFRIDDPYAMCFALFFLADIPKDNVWFFRSVCSLMHMSGQMLPWNEEMEDIETADEQWDERLTDFTRICRLEQEMPPEELDMLHSWHGNRNLAQIVYDLSRSVVPIGIHPFEKERRQLVDEGMDSEVARKVTEIAELLFVPRFRSALYRGEYWGEEEDRDEKEDRDEREDRDEEADRDEEEAEKESSRDAGRRENLQGDADELKQVQEELKKAKKQIKNLQSALSEEKRTADSDRAKYERDLKVLRMEHRELSDLRELLFNQENEIRETPTKGYTYPYETRKRTVVFGGHDTFLKAIRPMLPTVKFVDSSMLSFDPGIVRNSEVVWVQNNCMSHPQYWSVVRNCKRFGVQLRYFGFASAEKCAEQLVTEDLR